MKVCTKLKEIELEKQYDNAIFDIRVLYFFFCFSKRMRETKIEKKLWLFFHFHANNLTVFLMFHPINFLWFGN